MTNKSTIYLFFALFLGYFSANAQAYENAIGLRGGFHSGITFKHFIDDNKALEAIVDSRWRGFEVVGLLEFQNEITDVEGISWYYGFGAHIGFYDDKYVGWGESTSYMVIGPDGILGIEYAIPSIPIAISLDWKPSFNLIGYSHFYGDEGAFSIRYTF